MELSQIEIHGDLFFSWFDCKVISNLTQEWIDLSSMMKGLGILWCQVVKSQIAQALEFRIDGQL